MRRGSQHNRFFLEHLEDRVLPAGSAFLLDPADYNPNHLLVRFEPDANPVLPDGFELDSSWGLVSGLHEVHWSGDMTFESALRTLRSSPGVLYAHPDYRIELNLVPNDSQFDQMWALDNTGQTGGTFDADINAPEAWDQTTGNSSVIVAVIDTGVDYLHPDLAGNMWVNEDETPGNGIDDDNNGYVDDVYGYDFANNDGDPMDDHFHGTHVAGTIGAVGDNSAGVVGVAWDVQIMALKFLDSGGGGYLSDAVSAIDYAVANGAHLTSNSWGGGGYEQSLYDAIDAARDAGQIFVAAAGNDGFNNDVFPAYPATYNLDNVISVAATDHNDQLASFSNYGANTVDLGAPGVSILSTLPTQVTPAMQQFGLSANYGSISGTSMATPHVSGVVALVKGQHMGWGYEQIISQVLDTTTPIAALDGITVTGGRLDAAAAVGNPVPDTKGPRVVSTNPSGAVSGSVASVRFVFNEAVTDFDNTDVTNFSGPSGAISIDSVQAVTGTNDKQWDISFAEQSEFGAYSFTIGPNIFDSFGNAFDQNGDGTPDQYTVNFTISDAFVFTSFDSGTVTGGAIAFSELTISEDISIADLDVGLNMMHPSLADLDVYLVHPNGSWIGLSAFPNTAVGFDFQDTNFSDEATTPISQAGTSPHTGTFKPSGPGGLADFDGLSTQGTWTLEIWNWGFSNAELSDWSLIVQPAGSPSDPPPPPPPSPQPNNPPIAEYDFAITNENTPVIVDVLANDYDPDGDAISLTSIDYVYGGSAVVNADESVTFTPDPGFFGWASFGYTITDGQDFGFGWADIDVQFANDPPVAVDDAASTSRDTPVTFGWNFGDEPPLESNDYDPDGDFVWITGVGNAVHGTVALNFDGSVTFTPEAGYAGDASFEYTITDGEFSDTGNVSIDVSDVFYFSTNESGTLTGSDGVSVNFTKSDILELRVSGESYSYAMYFDASDVGLTTNGENIDAFTVLWDGSILISTTGNFNVPSIFGSVQGTRSDLLQFYPFSLGNNTSGDWFLYFDGSDVGLTGRSENIDAVGQLFDGSLLISTNGNTTVPGASAADNDLLRFTPWSLGDFTQGSWSQYFDGSDVGLSTRAEDVAGVSVQDNGFGLPTLYFNTRGNFSVPGLSGANDDIFAFNPTQLGSATQGSFGPGQTLDGSLYGLAGYNIDGITVGPVFTPFGVGGAQSVIPVTGGGSHTGQSSSASANAAGASAFVDTSDVAVDAGTAFWSIDGVSTEAGLNAKTTSPTSTAPNYSTVSPPGSAIEFGATETPASVQAAVDWLFSQLSNSPDAEHAFTAIVWDVFDGS